MPDFSVEPAFIRARSRRQALDWSLALLSQGIESRVLHHEGGWELEIAAADLPRATSTLEIYRREHRQWIRYFRRQPDGPGFHLGVLLWTALLIGFYAAVAFSPLGLKSRGMTTTAAVLEGEVWRLWTSITLHADLPHLIGNLTFGTLLLGFAMARFGAGWALLGSLLGGVAGNVMSAAIHGLDHRGLGASGMVMAALGMLAAGSLSALPARTPFRGWLFRGLFSATLLFLLLGMDPSSDVVAHAGGFVAGCLIGIGLRGMRRSLRTNNPVNQGTAIVALLMVLAAWSAALGFQS